MRRRAGQLSHMVVGDGSFNNHRVSIHVPSYKNTPTVPFMLRGNTVADAGLIIAKHRPLLQLPRQIRCTSLH